MLTIVAKSVFFCSTYRTTISKVRLFHHLDLLSTNLLHSKVEEGDRIAQLILERIYTPDVLEVNVSELDIIRYPLCLSPPMLCRILKKLSAEQAVLDQPVVTERYKPMEDINPA